MTIRVIPHLRARPGLDAVAAAPTVGERIAAQADLVIRRALERDGRALRDLAALDSAPALPAGEHLIAEIAGRPVAAVDVRSGRVVSDPFVPSTAADLLALRARQLSP